jgi:small-conductance mechanosensitive channel
MKKKKHLRRKKNTVRSAKGRLKRFRQASTLAISMTGFLLILFSFSEADILPEKENFLYLNAVTNSIDNGIDSAENDKATEEAIGALQDLWNNFLYIAPKLLIALAFIALSWLLINLVRRLLRKVLDKASSSKGIISLASIAMWILVTGVVFSIIAGDMRALLGSIGLVGLALSWALQTPIESLTGWLLNAFKHYYKIGDRIKVGDVFGDVYKIDFLTTTIWEIGSLSQPGYVNAEQPTGRMVTFPNNVILADSVVNYTGDFPYVWDELVFGITNESDIEYAMQLFKETSDKIIGKYMEKPIRIYTNILNKAGLPSNLPSSPQVYFSPTDSWVDVSIRYLVGARERREWKTKLFLQMNEILEQKVSKSKIFPSYHRYQVELIAEKQNPQV